jgi:hypothetical protein
MQRSSVQHAAVALLTARRVEVDELKSDSRRGKLVELKTYRWRLRTRRE